MFTSHLDISASFNDEWLEQGSTGHGSQIRRNKKQQTQNCENPADAKWGSS